MMAAIDAMIGEVAVADENDDGVAGGAIAIIDQAAPENWRRKLGRIAFQLIAGSDGGVEMYAKARERVDEVEAKATVTKMIAEAVGRSALCDPAVMERAKARYLSDALRGQENVEAVFQAALPHIPMDDDSVQADSADGLEQDWADAFARQAELASSTELRARLGKVLAGEIKCKGTYPRSVVRIIAELEQSEIEAVIDVGNSILEGMLFIDPDSRNRIPMETLLILGAEGIISDPGAGLTMTKTIRPDGLTCFLGSEKSILIKGESETKITFDVLALSKTGRAVAELLGPFDNRELFYRMSSSLEGKVKETAIISTVLVNGVIEEQDKEVIYSAPNQ